LVRAEADVQARQRQGFAQVIGLHASKLSAAAERQQERLVGAAVGCKKEGNLVCKHCPRGEYAGGAFADADDDGDEVGRVSENSLQDE